MKGASLADKCHVGKSSTSFFHAHIPFKFGKQASLDFIGKIENGGWSLLRNGEFKTMIDI